MPTLPCLARDRGEFLEWAEVHGNYYTSRGVAQQQVEAGRDTLLEIDWQGAQQVRKHFPDAVGVFILPPSMMADSRPACRSQYRQRRGHQPQLLGARGKCAMSRNSTTL